MLTRRQLLLMTGLGGLSVGGCALRTSGLSDSQLIVSILERGTRGIAVPGTHLADFAEQYLAANQVSRSKLAMQRLFQGLEALHLESVLPAEVQYRCRRFARFLTTDFILATNLGDSDWHPGADIVFHGYRPGQACNPYATRVTAGAGSEPAREATPAGTG